MALLAILIGVKAANRAALLEKELTKLREEVTSLRVSLNKDSNQPTRQQSSVEEVTKEANSSSYKEHDPITDRASYLNTTHQAQYQTSEVQLDVFSQEQESILPSRVQSLFSNIQEICPSLPV